MKLRAFLQLLRNPIFFLVRGQWIERNEPLIVIDVSDHLDKHWLARKGNEKAEYIMIGFKLPKPAAHQTVDEK